mmetsp:Transcript_11027/g.31395  ORF Transcript_11027/g.31395 Transcript_11027/m.31395 type:complete len:376 (+) Transcript_11027:76-1203(+)
MTDGNLFRYDTGRGALYTALSVTRTVVPSVLSVPEFWLFLLLHLAVFTAYRSGRISDKLTDKFEDWGLDWEDIRVVTAITTLFEVFYTNACYARYNALYKSTKSMLNDVASYAYMLRIFVAEQAPSQARRASRFIMAGVMLHFQDIQGKHSRADLDELCGLGLISELEQSNLLSKEACDRAGLVLQWALMVSREAAVLVDEKGAALTLANLMVKIRAQQQEAADTLALPIPFQYFHLLSMMIIINLGLWAFAMGLTASWFAPVVYVFCSGTFIGMLNLAGKLSDPFGDDAVDFDVHRWTSACLALVVELMETQYPGGPEGLSVCLESEEPLPHMPRSRPNVFRRRPRKLPLQPSASPMSRLFSPLPSRELGSTQW